MKSVKNLEKRIEKELGKEGWKLEFCKYGYWDNVPCAVKEEKYYDNAFECEQTREIKVAMVWDIYDSTGGVSIVRFDRSVTDVTWDYIKEVIKGEYESLGLKNFRNEGFGVKQKFLAWERE